jgi:HPt (histidine-containing phosphotransfer) domain-containing protein
MRNVNRAPVFDQEHLARYTMSSVELEREIVGLFLDQLPSLLTSLKTPADANDWSLFAHTLKGSAKAVGAMQVAEIAAEMEHMGPQAGQGMIAELEAAIEAFRAVAARTYG